MNKKTQKEMIIKKYMERDFTYLKGDGQKKSQCCYCGGSIGYECSRWKANGGEAEYHGGICIAELVQKLIN